MSKVMNLREYSIYTNKYGQKMKKGMLYRSGRLYDCDEEDIKYLKTLNLGYILDFRTADEAEKMQDPQIGDAKIINIPLASNEIMKSEEFDPEKDASFKRLLDHANYESYLQSYADMPFHNPCVQMLLDVCLNDDDKPILHHCSAGKDRAGIATLVLLKALDVDDETIVEDYMKSEEYYDQLMASIFEGANEEEVKLYSPMIHFIAVTDERYIRHSLKVIAEKYPDYDEFLLQEYGIDEIKHQKLRDKYLEK